MTLREIIETHPDWLDYDIGVSQTDGYYDYVGASGTVFVDDERGEDGELTGRKLVVFAGN